MADSAFIDAKINAILTSKQKKNHKMWIFILTFNALVRNKQDMTALDDVIRSVLGACLKTPWTYCLVGVYYPALPNISGTNVRDDFLDSHTSL